MQLTSIETLQCGRQALKQKQTFPVIADGWTDSATQNPEAGSNADSLREPKDSIAFGLET